MTQTTVSDLNLLTEANRRAASRKSVAIRIYTQGAFHMGRIGGPVRRLMERRVREARAARLALRDARTALGLCPECGHTPPVCRPAFCP